VEFIEFLIEYGVERLVEELNKASKSFKEFASFILSIKPPDDYTKRSFNDIHLVSLYSQNSILCIFNLYSYTLTFLNSSPLTLEPKIIERTTPKTPPIK
jgi:hypothetical protein